MEANGRRSLRVAQFAGTMRPGHDGVTRVLYRMIDGMKDAGIESLFLSAIVPPAEERPVPMIQVPSVPFPLYKDYRVAAPGFSRFESALDRFRPDLLHFHSPCPLALAALAYGRKNGLPVVSTYHTHFASYAKYYKIRAIEAFGWNYLKGLYNRCQRTFVPSHSIVNELTARGIQNLECLPHGVNNETFHPRHRSQEWRDRVSPAGKPILLFAGRLVWEKDLRTLMEVYRILSERRSDWHLVLAGDGPIRAELQEAMPGASFLGQVGSADLAVAYASSDLFVFPSTTETFGNVVLEAMASGVPPICSREGGASGSVKNGVTGYVTAPRDPFDIVSRVEYLLDWVDVRKGVGERAFAYAQTQGWENVLARLFAAYEEVVRGYVPVGRVRRKKAA
jgi:glycosyltransferase involved in cell wall biosynthesis